MEELYIKHELVVYEDGNYRSVDIERIVGYAPFKIGDRTMHNPIYRKREYRPTAASMRRVHQAATKLVNDRNAEISLRSKMYTLELDY